MYVFWFNSKNGRDDTLYCSKVIKSEKCGSKIKVYLDPNGSIPKLEARTGKDGTWFCLPIEEGKIKKRCFWLEEEDYKRAMEIENDYLKIQWLKMREQIQKFKNKYDFEKEPW